MNYKELNFTVPGEDYCRDLLINSLSQIGFDTFEDTEAGFKAYIPDSEFNQETLDNTLQDFKESFEFSYQTSFIPHKNWNEEWESNFEPLNIKDQCYVRATFHAPQPQYPYEIVIDPKMAFGTGHHQTTAMMMEFMLEEDWKDKKVLDMGCGTGILAILAAKLGAGELLAIDYDPICYESTQENARLNQVPQIEALCGSKEVIPDQKFEVILANINRNILLDQMDRYAEVLTPTGLLYLSGFYEQPDLDIIIEKAASLNLTYVQHKKNNNWVAAKFHHSVK